MNKVSKKLKNRTSSSIFSDSFFAARTEGEETASLISKSLHPGSNLEKTLRNVVSALVDNSEISFAGVSLFMDGEGNCLNLNVSEGVRRPGIDPVRFPLTLYDENWGELVVQPENGFGVDDINELFDYLLPIITITVRDSLLLRTVTDYKENLELKVEKRTAELIKTQVRLSKTIDLLRETQNVQNRFFANISHEFKTPLTLILEPSRQIMGTVGDEAIREEANLIYRSAKKLNRLADQLLDISRIEAGRMKLGVRREDIVPLLAEITDSFRLLSEKRGISIRFKPECEKINLYIDRDKIDKIFCNILSNALKFTPKGGSVSVEVLKDRKSCSVQIIVRDTGLGIPPEHLGKIFDRFYQVDNHCSGHYEGTGIGLALTKELIDLHKGKITVESEEGRGSAFIVSLPAGDELFAPDEILKEDSEPVNAAFTSVRDNGLIWEKDNGLFSNASLPDDKKPLILVVEDNPELRHYLRELLQSRYNVLEASDGEEGLKYAFDNTPDLVVSDIMMPEMDGIHLCKTIKSNQVVSHIPVILLTARSSLRDKIEGLRSGADDYVIKPFEGAELNARINNILEQRKRLHDHFKQHGLIEPDDKQITSLDQQFIRKATKLIDKHFADPSFNINTFTKELEVSRSLLYKKFISLIGEPPGEFVRRVRLNKAAELIRNNAGNITEVAFDVGFSDSSYFTACFRKQFGVTPSHYQQSLI